MLPRYLYHNKLPACQGTCNEKTKAVLSFPTVLIVHGMISFEAHACRDLAAARDRHHLFRRLPSSSAIFGRRGDLCAR
jgi:hypothetical protein